MALNKEQQKKVIEHLNSKWKGERVCPVCNTNKWTVHPELYELRQFSGGGLSVGGPLVPLIVVECENCGNTITFNGMRAEILEQENKEGAENV